MVGQQCGPYQIVGELPAGPFGPVWNGVDARGNDAVIVCGLGPAPPERGKEISDRLVRAVEGLRSLDAGGILPLRDVLSHGGEGFAVYEGTPLPSVHATLQRGGPMPSAGAVNVFRHVARTLSHIHARGVFHSCLCPQNVFASPMGDVRVGDVGLALLAALWRGGRPEIAAESQRYFAPEVLTAGTIDARTDIYALGALIYKMMTDRAPMLLAEALWEASQRGDRALAQRVRAERAQGFQHLDDAFAEPRLVKAGSSGPLSNAAMLCLNADPETRPQSMDELTEYVRQFGIYFPEDSQAGPG